MKISNSSLLAHFQSATGVCTDTRKIQKGNMFFALKGANFNGNTFALKAIEMGASYAIVDEPIQGHENIIQVEDVLKSLQDLAHYHRKQLGLPVIAIAAGLRPIASVIAASNAITDFAPKVFGRL